MRMRAVIVLAGVAALTIATSAITFLTGGTARPFFVGKLAAGGEPDAVSGNGRHDRERGAGHLRGLPRRPARVSGRRDPADVAEQAEATFEGIAAKDAKAGDPKGKGHKWQQYGPTENAHRARRPRLLGRDEQHREPHDRARDRSRLRREGQGRLPHLDRRLGRRRLADRQRARRPTPSGSSSSPSSSTRTRSAS